MFLADQIRPLDQHIDVRAVVRLRRVREMVRMRRDLALRRDTVAMLPLGVISHLFHRSEEDIALTITGGFRHACFYHVESTGISRS